MLAQAKVQIQETATIKQKPTFEQARKRYPQKLLQEMDDFAFDLAEKVASKTFQKIQHSAPDGLEAQDIHADLLLAYCNEFWRIDLTKCPNWKGYISTAFSTYKKDIMMKIYDNKHRDASVILNTECDTGKEFSEEGVVEHIVIDVRNPEAILIDKHEERDVARKVDILLKDISDFCEDFGLEFNPEDPMESLKAVLNLTLNEFTDEEFLKLDPDVRYRLGDLGDALVHRGIYIRLDDRRIKVEGIVAILRKYFERGISDSADVLRELDRNGVFYNKASVQAIVPELRKEFGLPPKKPGHHSSISSIIKKEFDQGRGIVTVPEMAMRLKELGVPYIPSSLSFAVYELRKEYGLKRK